MLNDNLRWSNETLRNKDYLDKVEELYKKGLESVKGFKLYDYTVNLNNPKEVIAILFLLAEDYNRFHERG